MRISTHQIQAAAISAIVNQQADLSRTQQQLSSGRRILSPSDDPVDATRALGISQSISATQQFQTNSGLAEGRLQLEESALEGAGNLLQRVRELTIQANNDSQNGTTRPLIALEIRQRLDELLSLSNTRDANGEYIFSGFQSLTQAFSQTSGSFIYNGDEGQRFLQTGPSRQVSTGNAGSEVFQLIKNGNGTFTVNDNTLNTGSGIIDPGSVTDVSAYTVDTFQIVLGEQTNVTGGAIGITDTGTNDTLQYELRVNGTLVYTANEGDSRTLAQIEADIDAQSGTTNVEAFIDGGQLYLANVTPSATPITINETLTGATEDTDVVTGFFGASLTGLSQPSVSTVYNDATGYVVLDSANAIVSSGAYSDGGNIAFNGIQTNVSGTPSNGDRFTVAPSTNQALFSTLQNLIGALEADPAIAGNETEFHNAINRVLVDLDQGLTNIIDIRANVGARLNSIEDQNGLNDESLLQLQTTLSDIQDLDYAEAISRLESQRIGLEAAQQSFVRIQGLSLFNFL